MYKFFCPTHSPHPIIILTPQTPSNKILKGLEKFPDVYFHVGTPTNVEDLLYCNVLNAFVIIYTNDSCYTDDYYAENEALQDREQLANILHLERLFPKIRVISCLMFSDNLNYLETNAQSLVGQELDPAFNKSHRMSTWNKVAPDLVNELENFKALGAVNYFGIQDDRKNSGNDDYESGSTRKSVNGRHRNSLLGRLEDDFDDDSDGTNIIHPHMSYLYKESFASGKTFTMSMFDTLLYQSYDKTFLPELLKLMLGLTYANWVLVGAFFERKKIFEKKNSKNIFFSKNLKQSPLPKAAAAWAFTASIQPRTPCSITANSTEN